MPSTYAHHRFGTALFRTMPGDVRRTISRFPRLFDVGLQGPDIFYYSSPLLKTNTSFLGIRFHEQTGQEFFQRVCRVVRADKSEAAKAYLFGVLCHYCLDSVCQSFIAEHAQLSGVPHLEIETEFDRFLLEKDGKELLTIRHCTDSLALLVSSNPLTINSFTKLHNRITPLTHTRDEVYWRYTLFATFINYADNTTTLWQTSYPLSCI